MARAGIVLVLMLLSAINAAVADTYVDVVTALYKGADKKLRERLDNLSFEKSGFIKTAIVIYREKHKTLDELFAGLGVGVPGYIKESGLTLDDWTTHSLTKKFHCAEYNQADILWLDKMPGQIYKKIKGRLPWRMHQAVGIQMKLYETYQMHRAFYDYSCLERTGFESICVKKVSCMPKFAPVSFDGIVIKPAAFNKAENFQFRSWLSELSINPNRHNHAIGIERLSTMSGRFFQILGKYNERVRRYCMLGHRKNLSCSDLLAFCGHVGMGVYFQNMERQCRK